MVHSWFASTDDWDNQFEGHTQGWRAFFRILRLYLTHFPGQPCSAFQLMGFGPEPKAKAWDALTGSLGLAGAAVGQRMKTGSGAPPSPAWSNGWEKKPTPKSCCFDWTSLPRALPTSSPCPWADKSYCRYAFIFTATRRPPLPLKLNRCGKRG